MQRGEKRDFTPLLPLLISKAQASAPGPAMQQHERAGGGIAVDLGGSSLLLPSAIGDGCGRICFVLAHMRTGLVKLKLS